MKETTGNLWQYNGDATVITTNGTINKHGLAVMGKGCAKEACQRFPGMARLLGDSLRNGGNKSFAFQMELGGSIIITFPVKHNWWEKADINLIKQSARDLEIHANRLGLIDLIMPRPGCGNGKLNWEDVKPVIEPILDDRFTVITYG